MATVKFLLKGKGESSSIYVRLRDGRQTDVMVTTGYLIDSDKWNPKKEEPRQLASNQDKLNLSTKLNKLKAEIKSSLNMDKGSGVDIKKDWLERVISEFKNPELKGGSIRLIDAIKNYQNELNVKINPRTQRKISKATINGFNTLISRIERFEAGTRKIYLLSEIDLKFHKSYMQHAQDHLMLSINSIGKDLRQIKTVCLDARDKGLLINRQVESRKFNVPKEPTMFVTLNEDEINLIYQSQLDQNYLKNARDWLIIGCWTGCRVNDLMKLSISNIQKDNNEREFIRYIQSKTNKQIDLPIHPHVKSILKRRGGFPRPISDVKFNKYIKEVCKEVGFNQVIKGSKQNSKTQLKEVGMFEKWELIKSHTCRRSFATNHYNKLPNKVIMAVTGHSTEKMLLQYIGEVENNHLQDFMNLWGGGFNTRRKWKNG